MEKKALSDYIKIIRQFYPCSAGISKEQLSILTADPWQAEWESFRAASASKLSQKDKWKGFIKMLQSELGGCTIEDRTVDSPLSHPAWSAHITLPADPARRKIIFHRSVFANLSGLTFIDYEIMNIEDPLLELKNKSPLIFTNRYSFYPQDEKLEAFAVRLRQLGSAWFSCDFLPPEYARYAINDVVYTQSTSLSDPTASILYFLFFGEHIW